MALGTTRLPFGAVGPKHSLALVPAMGRGVWNAPNPLSVVTTLARKLGSLEKFAKMTRVVKDMATLMMVGTRTLRVVGVAVVLELTCTFFLMGFIHVNAGRRASQLFTLEKQ